jgi:mannose/cellobiose epimerase-like protein (N-acyl-D-glucosamine 2-epimerase family)
MDKQPIDAEKRTWTTVDQAQQMYDAMSDSERHGLIFGLFPAGPMQEAEKQGFNGHALAVALMALASAKQTEQRAQQATRKQTRNGR